MTRYQLLFPLLSLLNMCQKEDKLDFSLTPATQTGANTLSCKVDGQVFRPYGRRCVNYGGGCSEGIQTYYNSKRGELYIRAILYAEGKDQSVTISGDSIFRTGQVVRLLPTTYYAAGVSYTDNLLKTSYHSVPPAYTSVVLTRLDTVAHIISGTFEGDLKSWLINPTTQKPAVLVTDGRFDVAYTK